ncbi:NIGHT LIGHT-INDUCIBLE AND CLOCK-REGULATED GENE 2 [Hibiscus trionum]|uniref:NIGHT LIGHT-INDUCIBLE AND CLOCK-REGULATED GENE 2 n=1 Tax=Hibiscus trionum TaxID=183268 RepID=A0A9W7HMU2_HIBTR|nr:NIGHT LIGHT-INDUCIBLE AND CLOCK-REGULATED GENE 2 [Hibiscus trionum]
MFDWNDQELTNIIWGEAGETDDHIVPYQDGSENCHSKKERSEDTAAKSTEQKTPGDKVDLHRSSADLNANGRIATSRFGMDLWPELSLSSAAKTDHDSMASEVSDNLIEVTECSSKNGKEQGDFVDYSWANIGSFDDLDRIFSNDDPIFGNVSLGTADELWSSSKEVTNCPGKSFPTTVDSPSLALGALKSTSENLEVKRENKQEDNLFITLNYGKLDGSTSHGLRNVEFPRDKSKSVGETNAETGGETSAPKSHLVAEKVMTPNVLADKEYRQNKLLKFHKKPEDMGKSKIVQNLYGSRIPSGNLLIQCEKNSATSVVKSSPSSVASQQRQLQGSDSLQYQHISNTFVASSTYGNLTNQYPTIPVLSNIQSREIYHQPLLPSYEVSPVKSNPVNRSAPTAAKSSRMTPQEKIEKLRRRQQMQALLAIKNQQQQFTHQVPSTNHAVFQNFSQENQFQLAEDVEDLSPLASFDPNSPLEKNDSNTVAVAIDDHSAEDTVLNQLQDIIAKLDIRTRLCIRDSLFRLAQSAMQRHYASDTSSTGKISKDENEVSKEDKNHSRMSETETETNPIDRTVAHLLFHRPLVLSRKHPQTPESPASTKLPCEGKTVSKVPSPLLDPKHVEQFTNSPFVDASENAPNNQPADGGVSQRNLELF